MGKVKGFFGQHTVAFAIMVGIVLKTQPTAFVHECTKNFRYTMFEGLLPGYQLHHRFLRPQEHGVPAKRTRSYALVLKTGFELQYDMTEFSRLTTLTDADCGVFCIADPKEVGTYRSLFFCFFGDGKC